MAPSLRHILAVFFRGIRHSLPSRGFWHTRRRRGLDAGLPVPLGIPLEDLDKKVGRVGLDRLGGGAVSWQQMYFAVGLVVLVAQSRAAMPAARIVMPC